MPAAPSGDQVPVRLPRPDRSYIGSFQRRIILALALVAFVTLLAYIDRGGYRDAAGNEVSLLDCFYYATVSITTTGYGDVIPVTDRTRLITAVLITPARILFLILLVGTTLEFLAERTREAYRLRAWRARLKDHTIICGYGTKGHSAVQSILGAGTDRSKVVVVDPAEQALEKARSAGLAVVVGDAASTDVLRTAGIEHARAVVVAASRDDAAVLITLTARELNPTATIASAVREEENAHLLRHGGADSVITSSGAAGRLLGLATETPRVVSVLEDLISVGAGLDIEERQVDERHVGRPLADYDRRQLAVAVVRGEEIIRFDDERAEQLETGDRVVCLFNRDTLG